VLAAWQRTAELGIDPVNTPALIQQILKETPRMDKGSL
jgi:hypothetical protein